MATTPTSSAPERITAAQARRVAIAAQGLARARPAPGAATTRDVQRVIDTLGIVQIDSVNVLTRSQYLPFFSRLGPYDTDLVDRARDRAPRRMVEYWAHEASLVPPSTWPLLTFRMDRAHDESWGGMQAVAREHPELVAAVLAEVVARGPITARRLEAALEHELPRRTDEWGWNWSLVKNALEHLFWAGQISSAGRTAQFERRYAALPRVFGAAAGAVLSDRGQRPLPDESFVDLIRIAARAHGIGTELCLRDYFRLRPHQARPAISALVERGELLPVEIVGWGGAGPREPGRAAYLWHEARRPRAVRARSLLSPFDSLVWQRERVRGLFGFDYRLEIYVPQEQRVHGYYVLPFLLGDELVGRCDLKADRAAGALRVQSVHWESGRGGPTDREALADELALMAQWLGLASVAGESPAPGGRSTSAPLPGSGGEAVVLPD